MSPIIMDCEILGSAEADRAGDNGSNKITIVVSCDRYLLAKVIFDHRLVNGNADTATKIA